LKANAIFGLNTILGEFMIREIPQIPCPIPGALSLPDPELLPATLPANLRLTIQASPSGSNQSAEQNFLLLLERPQSSRRFVFFEHPKSEAKLQLLDGSDEMPSGGSQFVAKFRPNGGPGGSQTDKNANSAGMAEPAELLLLPQLEGFSLDQETDSLLYRPTTTGTPKLGRGNITLAGPSLSQQIY